MNKWLTIIVLTLIATTITFNYFQAHHQVESSLNNTTEVETVFEVPVMAPTVDVTPEVITSSEPVVLVVVTSPKPTPVVKTTPTVRPNTYVVSSLLTANGTTPNILIELSFFTKQTLNLTCLNWQNSSRPLLNTKNGTLYQFDGTSCQQGELAKLTYTLPNKMTKTTKLNLKSEISSFRLNLTGD
jgi:hypothetical protein